MSTQVATDRDLELVSEILTRSANDLYMVVDQELSVHDLRTERISKRAAGEGQIHISFRFGFEFGGDSFQGCLLMPLPEAMTLAGYLMMAPEEDILAYRTQEPNEMLKDAMLEINSFLAGSCDAAMRNWYPECAVRPQGCQGVRADVRPALEYIEGDELVLGRADAQIGDFDPFEMLLMIPALPGVD